MGYSIDMHLEPFFKIKTIKEKGEEKVKSCPNHGEIDSNYCKICGSEAQENTKSVEYCTDIEGIIGNDDLWWYHHDEYTYCFSNISDIGFSEPEKNRMININIDEIQIQIHKFKELHYINIKKIEKIIHEKISIEYGFFKHVW